MKLQKGKNYMRASIPPLFDLEFNQGLWNSGHVCPKAINDQILLVTMNKKNIYRYLDNSDYHDKANGKTFIWSSQASTTVASKKGQAVINHIQNNSSIHIFVRNSKLDKSGKAAPFEYFGKLQYISHNGECPISFKFKYLEA